MTVEHVLPRKMPPNSPWRAWYPDPEMRGACTESLGNLLLVTKEQNDRAGNLDLQRKLDVYFNTPNVPVPTINEDLRGPTEWTPTLIREREARLMGLIEEVWHFGLAKLNVPDLRSDAAEVAARQTREEILRGNDALSRPLKPPSSSWPTCAWPGPREAPCRSCCRA
jgi:hypothetical protein